MIRKAKPVGTSISGAYKHAGQFHARAKRVVTDQHGLSPRMQTAKQMPAGAGHPGILPSGKKAKPVGHEHRTDRVIAVGSLAVAPPVTGAFRFF